MLAVSFPGAQQKRSFAVAIGNPNAVPTKVENYQSLDARLKSREHDKRKFFPFLPLTTLFLLLTSSCSFNAQDRALRLMIWGDAAEVEFVRSLADRFEKEHPTLKVKIFSVNSTDYNQRLHALFLNRQAPDVMYVSREWLKFYASRGMIRDLASFVEKDREFDFNDFFPQVKNSFYVEGRPHAIAKDFTPLVIYYNEDLFKKAGLKLPARNWTWNDFLFAAKRLTKINKMLDGKLAVEEYGFIVDPWLNWIFPWIWQAGGNLIDEKKSKSMAADPQTVENNMRALQFLYDLIYKYQVAPDPKTTDTLGTAALFFSGRAGMCMYGRWVCLNFREVKNFKWNVAPLPKDKKNSNVLLTVGYAISSQSKQPENAWLLIKHLTDIPAQTEVAASGLAVPARKSVALSPVFLQSKTLPSVLNHNVFLESLEEVQFPPSLSRWPEIEEESINFLNLVFRQKKPLRDSILSFHEKLEAIFRTN